MATIVRKEGRVTGDIDLALIKEHGIKVDVASSAGGLPFYGFAVKVTGETPCAEGPNSTFGTLILVPGIVPTQLPVRK